MPPASPAFSALAFDRGDRVATPGWLHPAKGALGVVLCGSWGYEELCARRSWTALAQMIADAGSPCLRFDPPGVADALDEAELNLESWARTVAAAARALQAATGVRSIALVGLGLGAAAAYAAAPEVEALEGLALLAPPVRGRSWLRELKLWDAMLRAPSGAPASPSPHPTLAGFALPPALADDLTGLDLLQASAPRAKPVLILAHADRSALAQRLEAAGSTVTVAAFHGHAGLLTDPTRARTPELAWRTVADWVGTLPVARSATGARAASPAASPSLQAQDFTEEAVRFGPLGLIGVLCTPARGAAARAAILLNGGRDPHTGWARSTVRQARALARAGVATLRIDAAGLGDSPVRPGAPEEPLYSPAVAIDVGEALDFLQTRGWSGAWLVGRCSGAYAALESALVDPRVQGVVAVNALRLVWDPDETVAEALAERPLETYARVLELRHLARVMRGDVDVAAHLQTLARRGWKAARGGTSARAKASRLQDQAHARFAALRDRGVPVAFIHSDGDPAELEFARHLGPDAHGRDRAEAYPNITVATIPEADHNLTSDAAQESLIGHMNRLLETGGRQVGDTAGSASRARVSG